MTYSEHFIVLYKMAAPFSVIIRDIDVNAFENAAACTLSFLKIAFPQLFDGIEAQDPMYQHRVARGLAATVSLHCDAIACSRRNARKHCFHGVGGRIVGAFTVIGPEMTQGTKDIFSTEPGSDFHMTVEQALDIVTRFRLSVDGQAGTHPICRQLDVAEITQIVEEYVPQHLTNVVAMAM